jgi:hypothetical protein
MRQDNNGVCICRIPSPSSHHDHCLNDDCGKKIETIYEMYNRLEKQFNIAYQALKDCLGKTSDDVVEEICYEAFDEIEKLLARKEKLK